VYDVANYEDLQLAYFFLSMYSNLTKNAFRNKRRETFNAIDHKDIKEMYKFYKKSMVRED